MSRPTLQQAFSGKTVVLTGAASGLGRSLARLLIAAGAKVHALDIDPDGLDEISGWNEYPGEIISHVVDVADSQAMSVVLGGIIAASDKIDFLFNNAGVTLIGETHTLGFAQARRLLDINLLGSIHGIHSIYPQMIRQGHGHIVNTASVAGATGYASAASYAASKAAVLELTRSLKAEAVIHGVQVSAACPGYVSSGIFSQERIIGLDRETLIRRLPVKMMTPDVAANKLLSGVVSQKGVIVFPASAKFLWWLSCWLPAFTQPFHRRFLSDFRKS